VTDVSFQKNNLLNIFLPITKTTESRQVEKKADITSTREKLKQAVDEFAKQLNACAEANEHSQ